MSVSSARYSLAVTRSSLVIVHVVAAFSWLHSVSCASLEVSAASTDLLLMHLEHIPIVHVELVSCQYDAWILRSGEASDSHSLDCL